MKFKFRILDLFVITTVFASLAAAFQADLILFRQLLCISLVAVTSTGALLLFPKSKRSVQFVGGVGGLAGGLVYLLIAWFFAQLIYASQPFFRPRAIPLWWFDVVPAVVLSVLFGATLGPLVVLRFQNRPITSEFKKSFWFSVILLAGIFLLGLFAMFDRQTFQSRDWLVLALVLSFVFVIHTNDWIRRFDTAERGEAERDDG